LLGERGHGPAAVARSCGRPAWRMRWGVVAALTHVTRPPEAVCRRYGRWAGIGWMRGPRPAAATVRSYDARRAAASA
jgi:hypothetical protein